MAKIHDTKMSSSLCLFMMLISTWHGAEAFAPMGISTDKRDTGCFGSQVIIRKEQHRIGTIPLQMTPNIDEPGRCRTRRRKRDLFKRDLISKVGFSGVRSRRGLGRKTNSLSELHVKKNENDNDNKNDRNSNPIKAISASFQDLTKKFDEVGDKVEEILSRAFQKLPLPIQEGLSTAWTKFSDLFPSLRLAFLSFVTGAIITLTAILVPVYSNIESLSEPVTLFETILADLETGYVDPVDTNKLFETGVSAMLRSLDPYTEFEAKEEAEQLTEGIMGKYGGVGLVIAGPTPNTVAKSKGVTPGSQSSDQPSQNKILPQDAVDENNELIDGDATSSVYDDDDEEAAAERQNRKDELRALARVKEKGIRVVSAFEGYAFDYGMRVGDRLMAVDDVEITSDTTVDQVRNVLRGEPGTMVSIQFEREGVNGVQMVTMPRRIVQLRDVKLATLIGKPSDGIGYISLSGFAASAGEEVRHSILALERAAEDASNGEHTLKGLILDLRGNPGGLLTSAVDVASLLVPNGSDIVSAKGRGFPGVTYRSRVDPILDPTTKLAVLVNRGTASAAEIVSGAVQDLDVGVIVGTDRTFGKGLVQNVEELPFDTALKFTVAKYYTPSGRCIQGVNYKEGGGLKEQDSKYVSSRVAEKDRQEYFTRRGRTVKDGGGIEADFKVAAPQASALEATLLRSDILPEFAAQWSRKNELTNHFEVDDGTYRQFQDFVETKRKAGDIKLDALYSESLDTLKKTLKQSGYKGSEREVSMLEASIIRDIKQDFEKYKKDIKEDIANSILVRYLPESMIIERSLTTDVQVEAAAKLLRNDKNFDQLLAKGSNEERSSGLGAIDIATDSSDRPNDGASLAVDW